MDSVEDSETCLSNYLVYDNEKAGEGRGQGWNQILKNMRYLPGS